MRYVFVWLLCSMAFSGCKKDNPPAIITSIDLQFTLESRYNTGKFTESTIKLTKTGDSVVGVVPELSNEKFFALSFTPSTANVKIGDVVQKSGVTINDFSKPLTYTFTNTDGAIKSLTVFLTNYTGIPIFYITTPTPVVSKDYYITGSLSVNPNGQYDQTTATIGLQIKGRGNSTWGMMPKKPYHLKFNSKAPLLGLPAAKNWVLLANYSDKTLIRNATAFDMGQLFSSSFAPHYRFVEVIMNGENLGNYTLTEQMEVNPGRVDITKMTLADTVDDKLTGGYLLELDQRLDAPKYFRSPQNLPFMICSPDSVQNKQFDYISQFIQDTENTLFASNFADPVNGYAKYINVNSFINWYLVKELMKDNDGKDFSSIFYFKDRNGLLTMGPIWDFDLAGGNTDYSDCQNPTGWWIQQSRWFNRLFQDPAFKNKVKERWKVLRVSAIPAVLQNIDKNAAYINLSQQQNFLKWNILNTYVWPNVVVLGNYNSEVGYLKTWLQTRISWMDANL